MGAFSLTGSERTLTARRFPSPRQFQLRTIIVPTFRRIECEGSSCVLVWEGFVLAGESMGFFHMCFVFGTLSWSREGGVPRVCGSFCFASYVIRTRNKVLA